MRLMNVGEVLNDDHMTSCKFSSRLIDMREAIESLRDQGEDKVNRVCGPLPNSSQFIPPRTQNTI